MRSWLKGTFTDAQGSPSFKRQLSLIALIMLGFAIFKEYPASTIDTLALLIGGILGITGVEKFSKNTPEKL